MTVSKILKHRKYLFVYVFFITFFFPFSAYAYLDPGSGNALIYLVISLLGTLVYFAKNIYYKILGKSNKNINISQEIGDEHNKILIFSEGKTYWLTFKPIIDAFIEKKVPFSYVSMDIHDPALTIDSPYMLSKYVGSGSSAFAKIANRSALVMLSTTPNIGCPNFPMPRPKNVQCLAHVCHAIGDIAMYHKGSLDHYDAVLMTGDHILESVRTLEKLRNLPAKECISLGLPYFDVLAKNIVKKEKLSENPTILLAPSWGDKSCIRLCGTDFIHEIAKANYNLIIRPHPHSYKAEPEFLEKLKVEFSQYKNILFDNDIDPSASFQKADVLISDKSNVRFDFALLYERPVISIDAPVKDLEQYEYADLGKCFEDSVQEELGAVIYPTGKFDILALIKESLEKPSSHFAAFREKYVANFPHAGKAIADWTIAKISTKNN